MYVYIVKFDNVGTAYVETLSYTNYQERYNKLLDVPAKYIFENAWDAQVKATALNMIQ